MRVKSRERPKSVGISMGKVINDVAQVAIFAFVSAVAFLP